MFGFLTDVWLGLAGLDPEVRTAAWILFLVEVAGVLAIRRLTARSADAPVVRLPVDPPRPRYRDAA